MEKIMIEKWGNAYSRAVHIFETLQPPHHFYLDDRCYSNNDKIQFFKDLQVVNNPCWEYLTVRITKRKCGRKVNL
jgi:hypothetical protein